MIILDNECTQGTRILYNDGRYEIKSAQLVSEKVNGIGALSDAGELVGVFLSGCDLNFIYKDKITSVDIETFKIENEYISKKKRRFRVYNYNHIICEIEYIPYIDPGMIIYDSDEDEFDSLLRISKMFKDCNATMNTIRYIKYL